MAAFGSFLAHAIASGNLLENDPFIVDLPIENGDFP